MKSLRQAVADRLLGDPELLNMLAKNECWWDSKRTKATKYSIVPSNKGPLHGTPYLTIQYLVDNQDGYMMKDAIFTVRCYNAIDRTYVDIDNVLGRVKALLHRHRFTDLNGDVPVLLEYETTGGEMEDQAYNQIFRESQFKLTYL